jgi:hypothetical protein
MHQHHWEIYTRNTNVAEACTNTIGNLIHTIPIKQGYAPTRFVATSTQLSCICGTYQHNWELPIHNIHVTAEFNNMIRNYRYTTVHNTQAAAPCTNITGNHIHKNMPQRYATINLGTTTIFSCLRGIHQHDWKPHIHNTHAGMEYINTIRNYTDTTPMRKRQALSRLGTLQKSQIPAACTNTMGNYIYTTLMPLRLAPTRLGNTCRQHSVAATCTNKIGTYYRTLVMQWHAPI